MAGVWLGGVVVLMELPKTQHATEDFDNRLYNKLELMFCEYAGVEVVLGGPYITGVYAATIKSCELHADDIVSRCRRAFEYVLEEHSEK